MPIKGAAKVVINGVDSTAKPRVVKPAKQQTIPEAQDAIAVMQANAARIRSKQ